MKRLTITTLIMILFFGNCTRVDEPIDPNGIAYKLPHINSVLIDGSDDDWNNAGFNARLFANHLGEFVTESDLSAETNLAWNKDGLLVFADVQDDTICEAEKGQALYNADCVELFMANRRNGTDIVQFVVAPGIDKRFPKLRVLKFDNRRTKERRKYEMEIKAAVKRTANGYSFEALIPFNLLLIEPKAEQELAFQIYINDRDSKDEKNPHSVKWHHLHGAHKLLWAFNRIVLSQETTPARTIAVKCNVIDEQLVRFYLIGDKKHIGETVTIDVGAENSLKVKLQKKLDYAFASVETAYPADSLQRIASIKIAGELVDMINLEEAWRIYKNTDAPNPYEADIQQFERMDTQNPPPKSAILFVGDSNIRLWKNLREDMEGLTVINRGFGGSKSIDLVDFADRIILPYKPKAIVVGSGNNDVNAGLPTKITVANYHELINIIHKALPNTRLLLLSMKPSLSAPEIIEKKRALNPEIRKIAAQYNFVEYVNVFDPLYDANGHLSEDLYLFDKAHLNENGYAIWAPIIKKQLLKIGD